MFKMARNGFLFLSLLFTVQSWAGQSYCSNEPVALGTYMQSDILSDADFKKAVACAINHGGADVTGASSFRSVYDLRIDDRQLNSIKVTDRHSKAEPFFNVKNLMMIKFQGVYENRMVTRVTCEVTVGYQTVPEKHVAISLKDCMANAFGVNPQHPLLAYAAYVKSK